MCREPRVQKNKKKSFKLLNSHPKTPKKSVVHHTGHQTRIPRHPKSLSCTTPAIKLASQDTQQVCRAPRWPSNSHPKTSKKSVVHHVGHQIRILRHPKSLSCTTLAIKLASQQTQKVCRASRRPSNSHPKTPNKSVVHHAGHQTRIPRHPKSLSCTTLAIKLASQDTQKVCRAPRWPSNSHPEKPKMSVVHHAGHQTRIPRHPKSLSCTTLVIKLASQDTQKVCRTPRWPSNSHPKTPKKSVVHHAGHQTRIPRHPKSLSCTTLAIKLASQDTQKVCRTPRWPSNSHPKTPKKSVVHHAGHQTRIPRHLKSLSCKPHWPSYPHPKTHNKSVVHHAGHQTRIPRHPKSLSCTTLAIKFASQHAQEVCRAPRWHQTRIPRHPKSLSCTTLAIKLASQDTQKVCRAPRWPSNSHPKTPKKSVVHHAGHQTRIPRRPKSLSCTTLPIKLESQDTHTQDTQKVCRAPRWPSNSYPKTPKKSVVHHAGHQTRIPRHPKSLSCTTLAIKLASQDTQKVCRAPRWPLNSHPKTPKKSVVHHAGHQTRIPRHPKSLSCTTLVIKLASQDTQKVCRAPRWPSNSHPKTPKKSVVHHAGHQTRIPRHPKSLSCTTLAVKTRVPKHPKSLLAIKLASQDTHKVSRPPHWSSNSHPKTPKKSVVHHAGHQTRIPTDPKSLSYTTLAIKLASQHTQKVCRAPRRPSNSHPKTPKKSVVHHAGHQTRIPRHPKSLSCTTLAIKLASQDTQKSIVHAGHQTRIPKVCRAPRWPSNSHPKTPKKSNVHHVGHQTRIPRYPKSLSCTTLAIKLASQDTQKVYRAPRWPSKLASQDTQKVCRATTLAIKLASQDTQKVCRAPRWPSNSHPKTPKKSVMHHAGHQTRIPRHPKSLSCTTLAIKLASQDT